MIKVKLSDEMDTSLAKEVVLHWVGDQHKTEQQIQNYNIAKAKQLINKDYCRWQNYLKLFNFAKRSKLEQAMLIYSMHCRFIEISLGTSVSYLLTKPIWKNKYFQYLFESILDKLGSSRRYDRNNLAELIPSVQKTISEHKLDVLTTDIYKPLLRPTNIIKLDKGE